MKRGFTLIEMLVVVAVMVTLMTMVFRLSSVGGDSSRRNTTIVRIQRLENCLSGYYAAFGCYPPVKLHGTRDLNQQVDAHGIQMGSEAINWNDESKAWRKVNAACRSQPVACNFPFSSDYSGVIDSISQINKEIAENPGDYNKDWDEKTCAKFKEGFDDAGAGSGATDRFDANKSKSDWRNIQLFRFGLMSYLLPRYLVMMKGDAASRSPFFDGSYSQWEDNNTKPSDPFTGERFNDWQDIQKLCNSGEKTDTAKIANIPTQAVCARWMPNLEGSCRCNHSIKVFGIEIYGQNANGLASGNEHLEIFSPYGGEDNYKDQYVLDGVSVQDGWWHDLYYYSPAPYQRYTLWSAGPNGRTFPPWISKKNLGKTANDVISKWTVDDIIHMSN